MMISSKSLLLIGGFFYFSQMLNAQPVSKLVTKTTDKIIIKYKQNQLLTDTSISSLLKNVTLSSSKPIKMKVLRQNALHANIVEVSVEGNKPTIEEVKELAKKLSKQVDVEYAEPDYIQQIMQVPNDTYYPTKHWHYQNTPGGANLEGAWDITTGNSSDVMAVIDTGILNHSELIGKTLPGYDFIIDTTVSNDGDARDDDPSDPGDNNNPSATNGSSWHGTHVAGTIAALSNNGEGITGINWNGKILPIRVLGVGGGYTSDITDGMLWAAGIHVDGVPDNPNPAKVLNLSLGGAHTCSSTEQNAIDAINNLDAIIVVAAGNENDDASNYSPASCNGVITVAASAMDGGRAYYSNYGNTIEITAPGGDAYEDTMVYSTLDSGFTSPLNDDAYASYQGTSMATPHIVGIVSLITSILPNADYTQVLNILQQTAKSFPTGTGNDCTTALCGVGIVDATAALTLASDPNAFAAKYSDMLLETADHLVYDFSDPSDIVDETSLWTIVNGALTSNDINDDESTSYQLNIPGTIFDLSFNYSIDAEINYDGLRYEQEGSTVFDRLETVSNDLYQQNTILTDGELNLKWTYHKDGSVSYGNDNASIDNLDITSYSSTSYNFLNNGATKKVLLITNSGLSDLTISNVVLSNTTDFSLENTCTQALKYTENCTITVEYLSSYDPTHSTTLSYNTNDSHHLSESKTFRVGNAAIVPIINYLLF